MDMAVEEEETSVNEASSISSDESVENKESDTEILLAKYEEKYKLSQIDKIVILFLIFFHAFYL